MYIWFLESVTLYTEYIYACICRLLVEQIFHDIIQQITVDGIESNPNNPNNPNDPHAAQNHTSTQHNSPQNLHILDLISTLLSISLKLFSLQKKYDPSDSHRPKSLKSPKSSQPSTRNGGKTSQKSSKNSNRNGGKSSDSSESSSRHPSDEGSENNPKKWRERPDDFFLNNLLASRWKSEYLLAVCLYIYIYTYIA